MEPQLQPSSDHTTVHKAGVAEPAASCLYVYSPLLPLLGEPLACKWIQECSSKTAFFNHPCTRGPKLWPHIRVEVIGAPYELLL